MVGAGTRSRTPTRRMATARVASGSPRTARKPGPADGTERISAARWAGVALVLASLLGTVGLAVISPASGGSGIDDAGAIAAPASAAPSLGPTEGRVPTGQPVIVDPVDGAVLDEYDIEIAVEVPEESLPRAQLALEVRVDGDPVAELPRPRPGTQAVPGVRLHTGDNVITAVMRGPDGSGPVSGQVLVRLDREPPSLALTSPAEAQETIEKSIRVVGSTDAWVSIEVRNTKTKSRQGETVGSDGTFDIPIALQKGKNRIRVIAVDEGGATVEAKRTVTRIGANPKIELKAPAKVKRSSLPQRVSISVVVRDGANRPIEDAQVTFTLGFLTQSTVSQDAETDASGEASWKTSLPRMAEDAVTVSVDVTTPAGINATRSMEIRVS